MENTGNRPVCVIGATNRPDSIDNALRRSGRFDREIAIGIPDDAARARILSVIAGKLRLEGDFDFHALARLTPGYVGADLHALTKEAAVIAVHRIFSSLDIRGKAAPADGDVAMGESDAANGDAANGDAANGDAVVSNGAQNAAAPPYDGIFILSFAYRC